MTPPNIYRQNLLLRILVNIKFLRQHLTPTRIPHRPDPPDYPCQKKHVKIRNAKRCKFKRQHTISKTTAFDKPT